MDSTPYVLCRLPVEGMLRQVPRFYTFGCGWTTKLHRALIFPTLADAEAARHHPDDRILSVPEAQSLALEFPHNH